MPLSPVQAAPTATQYRCVNCTDMRFYIMLQPDGSVEAFCQLHNHRQVIVNIPKLVASIFDDGWDRVKGQVSDPDISGDPSTPE